MQYYKTGSYSLLNVSINYDLTDWNYVLVDGFSEKGTNYALSLKFRR